MSETKFTPGPWNYFEPMVRAKGCTIAEVIPQSRGISDANARLIAAAPELYDALSDIVTVLTTPSGGLDREQRIKSHLKPALAILAKAVQP